VAKSKLIIALTGRRRSGKTTLAFWLQRSYGAFVAKSHLAIHHTAREVFDLELDQLDGARKDEVDPRWGISPRDAMRRVGRAVRHIFGESIWARRAASSIRTAEPGLFVFDNVRFPAELDALRELPDTDVILLKVVCSSDVPDPDEDHDTEGRIDELTPDFVLQAPRDGDGVTLCASAIDFLVVMLDRRPELMPFFDPGEGAPDEINVMPALPAVVPEA
jgi:hypothetical protein